MNILYNNGKELVVLGGLARAATAISRKGLVLE
jgi:hypothetical protein